METGELKRPCDCEAGFCNYFPNPFDGHICRQDAVEMAEELNAALATIAALRQTVERLEGVLRTVRSNMEARMVADFDHDKGEYAVTRDTIQTLLFERDDARSQVEALREALKRLEPWDNLGIARKALQGADKPGDGHDHP